MLWTEKVNRLELNSNFFPKMSFRIYINHHWFLVYRSVCEFATSFQNKVKHIISRNEDVSGSLKLPPKLQTSHFHTRQSKNKFSTHLRHWQKFKSCIHEIDDVDYYTSFKKKDMHNALCRYFFHVNREKFKFFTEGHSYLTSKAKRFFWKKKTPPMHLQCQG